MSGYEPYRDGRTNVLGFALSREQRAAERAARTIGREVLDGRARSVDEGHFPRAGLDAAWDSGLASLPAATGEGGDDADVMAHLLVAESLAVHCASTAMCLHMHLSALSLLCGALTGQQRSEIVGGIVSERGLCTYATSEVASGPRWWHMEQCVERTDTAYRIDAKKSWATSSGYVAYYLVPLRANAHAAPSELTLFLVSAEHVEAVGEWDGSGMRGNMSRPVVIQGELEERWRIGPSGYGLGVLMAHGLPSFQLGLAGVYLGVGQRALDEAGRHAVTRQYADTGATKAEAEATQTRFAELRMRLDQARAYAYATATSVSRRQAAGEDPVDMVEDSDLIVSLAQAKIGACEAATAVSAAALKICGGSAYKRGHPVERCCRDASAGSLMGLDDDSLKLLVGRRLFGQPFPWEH